MAAVSAPHSGALGTPITIRPSQIATPTPTLTENVERKKRDSRSPASLIAAVVARRSVPPASRMKRSRSDSCSSSTKINTTSTMPAVSSGTHAVASTRVTMTIGEDDAFAGASTGLGAAGALVR